MQKGKNKFNPNDKTNGYLNINGSFTSVTDWTCSGFIEINSNKYILSANTTATRVIWCEYDGSMNIIGTRHEVAYGNPIAIVSVNTKYIRVCFNDGTATDIQLEQGTTATTYESYVEDKIYIKNNNDVYEEFIKKEDVDYKPGEELIIPEGVMMTGNLTSGNSEIQCVFMTSKSLKNITNISIEDCLVVLRGINGYLDGDGTGIQLKGASNYTINTKIRNNAIIFSFVRTTNFNTTNNTPVVVYPISFKVILQ